MRHRTHIFPLCDVIEHNTDTAACICGPEIQMIGDGEDAFELVTHNQLSDLPRVRTAGATPLNRSRAPDTRDATQLES